jgi:hypothetical protein
MARVREKARQSSPSIRRPSDRRQIAAIRQLYRLNHEFAANVGDLGRKHRLSGNVLIALAVASLVAIGASMVGVGASCTNAASAPPSIWIGGAIKVAGC